MSKILDCVQLVILPKSSHSHCHLKIQKSKTKKLIKIKTYQKKNGTRAFLVAPETRTSRRRHKLIFSSSILNVVCSGSLWLRRSLAF